MRWSRRHIAHRQTVYSLWMGTQHSPPLTEIKFSLVHTSHTTAPPPPLIVQEGELIITGGTGRFEHATGRVPFTVYVSPISPPSSDASGRSASYSQARLPTDITADDPGRFPHPNCRKQRLCCII